MSEPRIIGTEEINSLVAESYCTGMNDAFDLMRKLIDSSRLDFHDALKNAVESKSREIAEGRA